MATFTPAPPWTDGQTVIRDQDGVQFIYSANLNALTVDFNVAGIEKDANSNRIVNLLDPRTGTGFEQDAATRFYVDTHVGGGGGIPEAPTDGGTYARRNAAWTRTYDGGAY